MFMSSKALRQSPGPSLQCEQTRPLLVLILFGLCDFCRQVGRLLEEVDQRLLGEERRQDLSVADCPLVVCGQSPVRRFGLFPVGGLADLQHEAGYRSDGLEEVSLLWVTVEHAVKRLTELDKLSLQKKRSWLSFCIESEQKGAAVVFST